MRYWVLLAMVACVVPVWGDEPSEMRPEADLAKTHEANALPAKEKPPLHEHPTLLKMLDRNNGLRSRLGLRPHRISPELTAAAQYHAEYMARTHDFNHYSNMGPQGRARRFGFLGGVRENIAMGQNQVDGAFSAWRNSGAHYASIVSNTSDAGFGYAISRGGTGYWVAMYGNGPAPRVEVLKPMVSDSGMPQAPATTAPMGK